MRAAIDTWGLWNRVAYIEEPYTMHGACHTTSFRCIHEQSRCERPHQVLGSPWERLVILREWKHRYREESKTGKEGNARINKVSTMGPGLAKIIEKVSISWYFECRETNFRIAENAWGIRYADSWSPKRVHCLSKSQSPDSSTSNCGFEDTLKLNTGVGAARLPIMGMYMQVALKSKIHWLPATFHNSRWMDHCEVWNGSIEAISILDPLDVKEAYIPIA